MLQQSTLKLKGGSLSCIDRSKVDSIVENVVIITLLLKKLINEDLRPDKPLLLKIENTLSFFIGSDLQRAA